MSIIINNSDKIDMSHLYKFQAGEKIKNLMSSMNNVKQNRLIKTASNQNQNEQLINLFMKMLSNLNLKNDGNVQSTIENLTKNAKIDKSSNGDKSDTIKIVSKHQKDSHYQIDISKDEINHDGKRVYMVSCYARDAYLGRYLIKRNFYYTIDREKIADSVYNEILTKTSHIKNRYYEGIIDVSAIFNQIKQILDGVISEIEYKE